MKAIVLAALLVFGFVAAPAGAQQGPKLFRDYQYGQSMESLRREKGVGPLPSQIPFPAGSLGKEEPFLGIPSIISFVNDGGKLKRITIISDYSYDLYIRTSAAMKDQKLVPVRAVGGGQSVDLFSLSRSGADISKIQSAVSKVEQIGLSQSNFVILFLEKSYVDSAGSQVREAQTLIDRIPLNSRVAELFVRGRYQLLTFIAPGAERAAEAARPKERF